MNNHHEAFEDVLDNSEKYEDFENYLKSNDERGADILYKIAVVRVCSLYTVSLLTEFYRES